MSLWTDFFAYAVKSKKIIRRWNQQNSSKKLYKQ